MNAVVGPVCQISAGAAVTEVEVRAIARDAAVEGLRRYNDMHLDAAMEVVQRCQRLHRARTLAFLPVVDLVEKAKSMGVRVILTHDPKLPNGVSVEFEPINTPAWLEPRS